MTPMTFGAGRGEETQVIARLRSDAATVEVAPHGLPRTGFLISVPWHSLAGRGDWSDAEILEWWRRVREVCTQPRPWFDALGSLHDFGPLLECISETTVLYAGTWTDRDTKWFDANLHIRRDVVVRDGVGLGDLHPPTARSPSSYWQVKRRGSRHLDALDVAFAVDRRLHQAAVWELDDEIPNGGRSWPVWY